MPLFKLLPTIQRFIKSKSKVPDDTILFLSDQIESWRTANRKMARGIQDADFDRIGTLPQLTEQDRRDGFVGVILSYGFGQDGHGNADTVLSGKLAGEYVRKRRKIKTWQCENVHPDRSDHFRSQGIWGPGIGNVDRNYPFFGIPTLRF